MFRSSSREAWSNTKHVRFIGKRCWSSWTSTVLGNSRTNGKLSVWILWNGDWRFLLWHNRLSFWSHLLKRPQQNDIEIPYNCAGILANILSDGIATWSIGSYLDQNVINQDMFEAVQTWDLRKSRTINYRSLAPILRLLDDSFPTGCVTWAVWAMTNLTTVLRMCSENENNVQYYYIFSRLCF